MFAFSAAKRAALLAVGLVFLVSAPLAVADEDSPGYLGIMLQNINSSMATALQLDGKTGVIITDVVEDSPAEKAGLKSGDVILLFDGDAVEGDGQFTRQVRQKNAGQKVKIVVLRDGDKKTLNVELGEREDGNFWLEGGDENVFMFKGDDGEDVHLKMLKDVHKDMAFFEKSDRGFMGVHLDRVEGQMARYFEVDGGALITEVNEDSPAAEAGLKAGDVIVKVDDQDIDSPEALHKAMAETKAEQEVKIKVVRKGKNKTIKVTLGEMPEDMAFKNIEIHTDGDNWTGHSPKMLFHGKGKNNPHANMKIFRSPGGVHDNMQWMHEGEDLDQMKKEIKELKKELKEIRKELNK